MFGGTPPRCKEAEVTKVKSVMIHPVVKCSNPEDHVVIAAYRNKAFAEKQIREKHQPNEPGFEFYVGKPIPLIEEHHL